MVTDSYKEYDLVVHMRLDRSAGIVNSNAVSSKERAALVEEIDRFVRDQHTPVHEIVFADDPEAKQPGDRESYVEARLDAEVSRLCARIEAIVARRSVA